MSASQHPAAGPWHFAGGYPSRSKPPAAHGARRALWPAASLAAAALTIGSYFLPWWSFTLYAPQYPHGLRLTVSLTGVSGDVHEVNMLNHYIGMKSLLHAAPLERSLALYGAVGVALLVLGCAPVKRDWLRRGAVLVSALLPAGFIIDSFLWLRHFGHALDSHAPIRLPPFTPEMFGNGTIGQFMTFARPDQGFVVALCAPLVLVLALTATRRGVEPASQ